MALFKPWNLKTKTFKTVDEIDGKKFSLILKSSNKELEAFDVDYRTTFWPASAFPFDKIGLHIQTMKENHPGLYNALEKVLLFFSAVEGPIGDNLGTFDEISSPHIKTLFNRQAVQEVEHGKTYSEMLIKGFNYTTDDIIKKMESELQTPLEKKLRWMDSHLNAGDSEKRTHLLVRLANSAFAEGILLQSSFTFILYLRSLNKFSNLDAIYNANNYILRDEMLHYRMFAWLFRQLRQSSSLSIDEMIQLDKKVEEGFKSCLQVEKDYFKYMYPIDLAADFTNEMMETHLDAVSKVIWDGLYPSNDDSTNQFSTPFNFWDVEVGVKSINHFELHSTAYVTVDDVVEYSDDEAD